jgi:hypothetical protein
VKSTCRLMAIVVNALAFIACSGQMASPSASPAVQVAAIEECHVALAS